MMGRSGISVCISYFFLGIEHRIEMTVLIVIR